MEFKTYAPDDPMLAAMENAKSSPDISESISRPQERTTGRIIFGAILSVIACALLVIFIRYLVLLPVTEANLEKAGGSILLGKAEQILESLTSGDITITWAGDIIAFVLLPIIGVCAGFMDDALCMLPLGRKIRAHIGFPITWPVRLAPAILFAVYMLITLALAAFKPEVSIAIEEFSWKGEGYTPAMWFSQIFYFLIGLSVLFLIAEALANSGLIGLLVRVPLLFATNLIMAVVLTALATAAFLLVIIVAGLAIGFLLCYIIFRVLAIITLLNS